MSNYIFIYYSNNYKCNIGTIQTQKKKHKLKKVNKTTVGTQIVAQAHKDWVTSPTSPIQ